LSGTPGFSTLGRQLIKKAQTMHIRTKYLYFIICKFSSFLFHVEAFIRQLP
jgi:hypothetical protein